MTEMQSGKKIGEWLASASRVLIPITKTPRLEAEILLAYRLGVGRSALLTIQPVELSATDEEWLNNAVKLRSGHLPLAYILGYKDFRDFRVKVTPDVLIPRPETESIVEKAIAMASRHPELVSGSHPIYDLGTGSGAIAIALARALPEAEIVASDISAAALAVAKENIVKSGLSERIQLAQSDLGLHIAHAKMIVANLPYLPDHLEVSADVRSEPAMALWSGLDGLEHYKRLFTETSFDTAVIELGADQYIPMEQWTSEHLLHKKTTPVRGIDNATVGMVIS